MKIAIDCRTITGSSGEMAGIGHYAFFLVRHLLRLDDRNRYVLLVEDGVSKTLLAEVIGSSQNVEVKTVKPRLVKGIPYLGSHRSVVKSLASSGIDLFHGTSGSLPLGHRGKSIVTVHDLAIYLHPEWFPGSQFFSKRIVVPAGLERTSRIISVSESTKRDLVKLFTVPPEKITVIHEGIEHHAMRDDVRREETLHERYTLDRPYIFSLGTIEPRKNLPMLIEAYTILAKRFPGLVGETELLIAGGMGWKTEATMKALKTAKESIGTGRLRIRYIGYVPSEDKWGLMAGATAFVFPSLYEGFGLPVLEAMSLGVPVIASDTSSLPEITGRGGALLVNPSDRAEWVLAMKHLLESTDARAELGRRGQERSTEFNWQKTAGETLEVYEDVMAGHGNEHGSMNLRHKWIDDTLFHAPHRSI